MAFCQSLGMSLQLVGAEQLRSQRLLTAVLEYKGISVEARLEAI